MALSLLDAFLLVILVEFVFQRMNLAPELRVIVLIVLLGVLTIASTLWLAFKLSEIKTEFHGLLSIFAINALFGIAMVWLGTLVENWLWQLNPSR